MDAGFFFVWSGRKVMEVYIAAFFSALISVGLKGFQHKNVIGNHYKAVFITSYLMAVMDVVAVTLIVKGGLVTAVFCGTGAAIGMVVAMKFHDRIFKKGEKL